ncbi:prepilin-type N-terminal cleavage/methylation domain-containing protein [Ideonella sp. DXS22W]|uniref:Prepilin-type N-terminal cleavage/methylation domain-containing protein n=2 Tax=Pseudaquabacterium inlustre TaxID=2984192 RepID=A0ABU9CRK1_9BURK
MARTPTSAPGSDGRPCGAARCHAGAAPSAHGFTLVELLVVMVLVAIVAGTAALALRDGESARLDREATRLAALLEAARAEARASGVAVRFELRDGGFAFAGLPERLRPPEGWLDSGVVARIENPAAALAGGSGASPPVVALGPEPLIGARRIVLSLGDRQRVLATDGLSPFALQDGGADAPP